MSIAASASTWSLLSRECNQEMPAATQARNGTYASTCMACLPTRRNYWKAVQEETNLLMWQRKAGRKWEEVVTEFSTGDRPQCPSCVVKNWKYYEELSNPSAD